MSLTPDDRKFIVDVLNANTGDPIKLQVLQVHGFMTPTVISNAPAPAVKHPAFDVVSNPEAGALATKGPAAAGKRDPVGGKMAALGPIESRDWISSLEAAEILGVTLEESRLIRKEEGWDTKPLGIGRALLILKADVLASKRDMQDAAPKASEIFDKPGPGFLRAAAAPEIEKPEDDREPPLPLGHAVEDKPQPVENIAEAPIVEKPGAAGLPPPTRDPQEGDDGVISLAGELWVKDTVAASCLNMSTGRFIKALPTPGTLRPVKNQNIDGMGALYSLEDIKKSKFYRTDGRMGF